MNLKKRQFVKQLLSNGFNQVQAYRAINKNKDYQVCSVGSTRFMKDKEVQKALKEGEIKLEIKADITRELQIRRLNKMLKILDIRKAGDRKDILAIMNMQNELNGLNSPIRTENRNINITKDDKQKAEIRKLAGEIFIKQSRNGEIKY